MKVVLPPRSRLRPLGQYGLVLAVTLAAYAPVWRAGFVWNDPDYVTRPALRSWAGLGRIWFDLGATEQYYPLLHSFFWIEHRLWGNGALGYHLVNVLLHGAAACLFGLALAKWRTAGSGSDARCPRGLDAASWLAALLFAVHPVCAESVAWISEQKNTLSLVFYLLAALAYLRFWSGRRTGAYLGSSALFACALLSKTVTATLPGALLVTIWWKRGRLERRRDVAPLLPWFAVGAAAGLGSAWVERVYVGAKGAAFALSPLQRLALAGRIPWFYLRKLLWPAHLVFIYPRWEVRVSDPFAWAGLAATLAVLAAGWAWRRRSRAPLAAALFFIGSLFPTLGFLNVYAFIYSFVADHWAYLGSLGVFAAAAGVLVAATHRWRRPAPGLAAAALLGVLGLLTRRQCLAYRDPVTFYRSIVAANPSAWMAESNLADMLAASGRPGEAIPLYRAALQVDPGLEQTHFNLAVALVKAGRLDEAAAEYRAALRLKPDFAAAHNGLGVVLERRGKLADAAGEYAAAVSIQPLYAGARRNLERVAAEEYSAGIAAVRAGDLPDAECRFSAAIRFHPRFPEAENALGAVLASLGRPAEAVRHYEAALRLRPEYPDARRNLALALRDLGR
ncbi:MAG: tetratricopeptide repeat protein [Opitutaceae bacterium]